MPDGMVMTQDANKTAQLLLVGAVTGPHGVRGQVRVKSFTQDPDQLVAYGPLTDATGTKTFSMIITGESKGQFLAKLSGVNDRNTAEAARGLQLFISRDALPETDEDEFYHADLLGLKAVLPDQTPLGTVRHVQNFGAGDLLEVDLEDGGTELYPFTLGVVPSVDIAGGKVVIDPPASVEAKSNDDQEGTEHAS